MEADDKDFGPCMQGDRRLGSPRKPEEATSFFEYSLGINRKLIGLIGLLKRVYGVLKRFLKLFFSIVF